MEIQKGLRQSVGYSQQQRQEYGFSFGESGNVCLWCFCFFNRFMEIRSGLGTLFVSKISRIFEVIGWWGDTYLSELIIQTRSIFIFCSDVLLVCFLLLCLIFCNIHVYLMTYLSIMGTKKLKATTECACWLNVAELVIRPRGIPQKFGYWSVIARTRLATKRWFRMLFLFMMS